MEKTTLDILMDGVPYLVKIEPFTFNTEPRFNVQYNDSPEYIFAWDKQALRFAPIGDVSSTIPDNLQEAIATKLYELVPSQGG